MSRSTIAYWISVALTFAMVIVALVAIWYGGWAIYKLFQSFSR